MDVSSGRSPGSLRTSLTRGGRSRFVRRLVSRRPSAPPPRHCPAARASSRRSGSNPFAAPGRKPTPTTPTQSSFPRNPFADVGRATEQLGALPLALHQEVDDIDADYGDSLQVQGGARTADLQLVRDVPEVLGLHGPDQPDGRPRPIRAALDLERHPPPPFRRTRAQRGAPEPSRCEAMKTPPSAPSGSC